MSTLPIIDLPEPCTHVGAAGYKRRAGFDACYDCERKRTDAAIKRAAEALKRIERKR